MFNKYLKLNRNSPIKRQETNFQYFFYDNQNKYAIILKSSIYVLSCSHEID